jgi:lipid-binding SYLF domain-containing protein|tara:strand:+ start:1926 stop:2090 length:165 start_codon:yes stop_codon:yes gene_type:complete
MDQDALEDFRDSDGWEAGVDGSIALIEFGAAEEINTNSILSSVLSFPTGVSCTT